MTKPLVALCLALSIALCGAAQANPQFGADRHAAAGVACTSCHGPDMKNMIDPSIEQCQQCHDVKALVEKTAHVKPTNPHTSPHYQDQLDCVNCHLMHEEPVNFCAQCHSFDFKVK